ncbi:MAG: collagenase-like protease, partial [Deltaproteobacteria bacterium CG_4_10_14_0_8_um_filter_43_12]
EIKVEVRNQIRLGDEVEFIGKSGEINHLFLEKMTNEDDETIEIAQPNQIVILTVNFPTSVTDLILKQK